MYRAVSGQTRNDAYVVHWTRQVPGTAPKRVRVLCGSRPRTSYFSVLPADDGSEITCKRCRESAPVDLSAASRAFGSLLP